MSSDGLGEAFSATESHLDELGVADGFIRDLITSRLVIERIGEVEPQEWWDSRVFSETGRDRLSEVTPRTWVKARIDLAMEVGKKAESERLPSDAVSLFSVTPRIESRVDATVEDISPDEDQRFPELEDLEVALEEPDWTSALIDEVEGEPATGLFEDLHFERSGVFELQADEEDLTQSEVEENRETILATLLYGYGYAIPDREITELRVPYYGLTADIEESAL